jgi:hypothetical protein
VGNNAGWAFRGRRPGFIARRGDSRTGGNGMLLQKGVPKEEIKKLKVGDFFIDSEIVSIKKGHYMLSFVTKTGNLFTAHEKLKTYNVFKKKKPEPKNPNIQ